jgi:hypothetical protein
LQPLNSGLLFLLALILRKKPSTPGMGVAFIGMLLFSPLSNMAFVTVGKDPYILTIRLDTYRQNGTGKA